MGAEAAESRLGRLVGFEPPRLPGKPNGFNAFLPGLFGFMMPVGQPEDRATQGCDLSAALEVGAGGPWRDGLPPCKVL